MSGNGTRWLPARPTVYNGVRMRSRLEAGFAMWADSVGLVWQYEPFAVADEHGQYLPDFLLPRAVWAIPGSAQIHPTFVEVKPEGWTSVPGNLEKVEWWSDVVETATPRDALVSSQFVLASPDRMVSSWGGAVRTMLVHEDILASTPEGGAPVPVAAPSLVFVCDPPCEPSRPWQGRWWAA